MHVVTVAEEPIAGAGSRLRWKVKAKMETICGSSISRRLTCGPSRFRPDRTVLSREARKFMGLLNKGPILPQQALTNQQKNLEKKIVTEILPAKKFHKAEEYHQHYLSKGGKSGHAQSPSKSCKDPISCFG
ncbi:hypothetical protein BRARA_H02203 [Brassica rapa]|uniref:peptide-methionine (S)-S-oxide reductase n=1 Tax=Brassica campestris TaxID=3711 RepID=A0A397YKG9_BRACM|nr:hypothetical protein BRARA_H02203 [Brassica rapa]